MPLTITVEGSAEIKTKVLRRKPELPTTSNTPEELGFTNVQNFCDIADELPDTDDSIFGALARP
jgi:hypothetical protein